MSDFKLSQRSLDTLEGVNPYLVGVVKRAIEITKVDFGVIEGLRTPERQRDLVQAGASQTMFSKHIQGKAVDLMAYIGSRASWELNLYDDIADAMKRAAQELQVPIRWGGAWNVSDINHYIDVRRGQGRKPFLDGPHFELV
jgi:peptidoglycan LD-endopeptidase CwlK